MIRTRFGARSAGRLVLAIVLVTMAAAAAIALRSPAAAPPSLSYFLVNDDPSVVDRRVQTQWDVAERLVADCMRTAGFSYVALSLQTARDADSGLSPHDRVAKEGFGATTRLDQPQIAEADPNMSYLQGLTPPRQQAYRAASFGDDTPADPGCQRTAQSTVHGPRAEAIASIDDLVAELATAKAEDPLVQQAEASWRACARAAGLPAGRQEIHSIGHDLFATRLSEAAGATGGYDANRLAALQDEERSVALAIYACDEAFADATRLPASSVEVGWATRNAERLGTLRVQLLEIDEDLARQSHALGLGDGSR